MATVITYGTFDLFHVGHVRILQAARKLGSRLVVGVSSDEFNSIKGKKSVFPYEQRAEIVNSCRYVDEVFPETRWEQKRSDIQRYQANIFVMGSDWEGKFDTFNDICEVKYLSRTEDISTTEIKRGLIAFRDDRLRDLVEGLDNIKAMINQLT